MQYVVVVGVPADREKYEEKGELRQHYRGSSLRVRVVYSYEYDEQYDTHKPTKESKLLQCQCTRIVLVLFSLCSTRILVVQSNIFYSQFSQYIQYEQYPPFSHFNFYNFELPHEYIELEQTTRLRVYDQCYIMLLYASVLSTLVVYIVYEYN